MTLVDSGLRPESPFLWRARRPGAARRLICFPHAGAGATAYADWSRWLPADIEVVAVQLPGRQNRIAEDFYTEVPPLVAALSHALGPVLDLPCAFFGHSAGAQLAYEVARALRDRGRTGPEHLFLSAQPAPGAPVRPVLHELPDAEFRAEMIRLGGIDPEIAADAPVMESLLAVLRADFGLWERHRVVPGEPLDCPITVLTGRSDPRASIADVDLWRAHTGAEFAARTYDGGHFYFLEAPDEVVAHIGAVMTATMTSGRIG